MSGHAPRRSVLRGIARLARFRPEGFAEFEATRQGFLNSLAPPLGLMLVACLLLAVRFGLPAGLQMLLIFVVALLGPLVVGEAMARWLRREARWLGYAVAYNWCQWAIPVVGILVVSAVGILAMAGVAEPVLRLLLRVAIGGYVLALYVFLARHGLALSWGQAAAFVVAMHLGAGLLLAVPEILSQLLS